MGTPRQILPHSLWVLLAVLAGALYGGWAPGVSWLQGALAGLAWALVLTALRILRRRRAPAPPH